jgi:hypothetical protein
MTHRQITNKEAMKAKYTKYLTALVILETVKFSQIINYGSNPSWHPIFLKSVVQNAFIDPKTYQLINPEFLQPLKAAFALLAE